MGGIVLGTTSLAGCIGGDSDDGGEEALFPALDMDTLQVETGVDGELLQAEAVWPGSTTFVGEATGGPNPFVGVALRGGGDQPDEIAVYLCGREVEAPVREEDWGGLWLTGAFEPGGVTLADEDVEAKVALVDGDIIGAAVGVDEESIVFRATEATDDAGMFFAEVGGETETIVRWIVLPDGRQRGTCCCPHCNILCGFPPCKGVLPQ